MTEQRRDELTRRMDEAVLLPPSDPVRRQVYHEILQAGEWAREHWLELVRQHERLRLDLLDVEPPAGLADRLTALADEPASVRPGPDRAGLLSRRRLLGMAASVAALASAGSVAWFGGTGRGVEGRFQELGEAVHAHHAVPHPVSFASSDPAQVPGQFAGAFEWDVRMPTMGRAYELIGAKACELAGEPVLCTQWRDSQRRRYSVFQFCAPDHGLPSDYGRRVVRAAEHSDVTFWTEGHCAYVMTADSEPAGQAAV